MSDRVVAEIPGQAAAEARQARPRSGAIAAQKRSDERERVALVTLDDAAAILHFDLPAARANAKLRRQADERIAAKALATDDRLEQVGVALVGELEIERKWGIEVRKRLENKRDAVIPKRSECAEFGFGHDAPTIL